MHIIAVSINKGGVGKTTLTKAVGTAATLSGLSVLILDMDTQQNATNWGRRRIQKHQLQLPIVKFVTEGDLSVELERAKNSGCDLVLIDTPPGRSTEALAAIEASSLVLIPFWNDQDSYDGVRKTFDLTRRLGKDAYGILNHSVPNSPSHEITAREVLAHFGLMMAPVTIHRYDVHRSSTPKGMTAQETDPSSKAATEIGLLWKWLCSIVQLCTMEQVNKIFSEDRVGGGNEQIKI